MKKVAILQSNYIPWKGYFDIISMVDEFIFFDEVQYTKNDWRNRNKIKTPNGSIWLTIPIKKGEHYKSLRIIDARINDLSWAKRHWDLIVQNYKKAPFFYEYRELFEELYLSKEETYLCEVNYKFIRAICNILGIKTKLSICTEYELIDGKIERLVDLIKQAKGTEYVSGPAAKDYIADERLFETAGIQMTWMDYSGYPEYPQCTPNFEHSVSILDLLFNVGSNAPQYIWGWREQKCLSRKED